MNIFSKRSIRFSVFILFTAVLLMACSLLSMIRPEPTATPLPTETETPSPVPPTETLAPTPTATETLTPSPTAVPLAGPVLESLHGAQVLYFDDFYFKGINGQMAEGWSGGEMSGLRVADPGVFRIISTDGMIFTFDDHILTPNQAVTFAFKYTGSAGNFTLGMDVVDSNDRIIPYMTNGYYSVAMQRDTGISAHIIQNGFQGDGYFDGDLRLKEDTWYGFLLAFDDVENYLIKIWLLDNPNKDLVYSRYWPDFPTRYSFISWIGPDRKLYLDDFTILSFDTMVLE